MPPNPQRDRERLILDDEEHIEEIEVIAVTSSGGRYRVVLTARDKSAIADVLYRGHDGHIHCHQID